MPELTVPSVRFARAGVTSADTGWMAVPAALFAAVRDLPFALFDGRGHVADLRMTRTVHVSPGD